jgi:hypothetical protein
MVATLGSTGREGCRMRTWFAALIRRRKQLAADEDPRLDQLHYKIVNACLERIESL